MNSIFFVEKITCLTQQLANKNSFWLQILKCHLKSSIDTNFGTTLFVLVKHLYHFSYWPNSAKKSIFVPKKTSNVCTALPLNHEELTYLYTPALSLQLLVDHKRGCDLEFRWSSDTSYRRKYISFYTILCFNIFNAAGMSWRQVQKYKTFSKMCTF